MNGEQQIIQTVTTALTGGPAKDAPRWQVTGTNIRGEHFTTPTFGRNPGYRNRWEAEAYRDEIIALGGTARVHRAGTR